MSDMLYAKEKMAQALSGMATTPTGLQERLHNAYLPLKLAGNALPDYLLPDQLWIISALTEEPDKGRGRLMATVEAMGDERAQEIADRIFSLAYRVLTEQEP